MFSPMIALASAITLVSAQNAKPEVWWRKDLRTLTGASDETWLRPGNGVIAEGDKVAVTTQDCSLIILDKYLQEGTVYSHHTSDDCSSAPIVRGESPNQVFMYTTSDGNVIAVNADGTEAWKTQVDIWGNSNSILSLSKTWHGMYAAHNAGDGAYITFIDHDGIVDQNRSVHIPRVQMYPMSAAWSGFLDLSPPEWFYFCVSTVTGGNYYLYKLSATTDAAEVERVGTMNHAGGINTPIVSDDHDANGYPYPYPKVWTTIQTAPAGFIGKNKSEPDWQLEKDGSNTNSLTLTEEGNLCFCSLKFCRCVDSLYGTTEWKKNLVDNLIIGNSNLYVPKSNSHTADATLLINNLMTSSASGFAKVTSVDPATGEVLWQLHCDDFQECTAGECTAGGGSMDYNDGRVYFSPVKYWVVATAARLSDGTKTFNSTDSAGSGSSCKICENCDEEITKDNITEILLGVILVLAVVAIVVLAVLLCQQSKGFSELSQRGSA